MTTSLKELKLIVGPKDLLKFMLNFKLMKHLLMRGKNVKDQLIIYLFFSKKVQKSCISSERLIPINYWRFISLILHYSNYFEKCPL